MTDALMKVLTQNGLITAFAVVGLISAIASLVSARLTGGRIHASAIAIVIGLAFAYLAGRGGAGSKGVADLPVLGGIGLMGGAMLRDYTIVATALEVDPRHLKDAGLLGSVALLLGTVVPFVCGVATAWCFGYRDPVVLTTIGAGAVTYIVGPVTGAEIGRAHV